MYQPHPFHHCILLIVCYHLSSSHSAPIAEVARVNIPSSDEYANSLALSSTDPSSKVFTSYQVRPYPQRPLADGTTTNNRPMSFSQFILNLIQQLSRSVGLLWNQFRCTVIRITMQVAQALRLQRGTNTGDYMNVAVCTNTPGWPKQANASLAALFEQLTNNRMANVSLVAGGGHRDATSLLLVGDCGPACRGLHSPSNNTVPTSNTFVLLAGDRPLPSASGSNHHPVGTNMATIPAPTVVDVNDNLLAQPEVIDTVEALAELIQRQQQATHRQEDRIDRAKRTKMTGARLMASDDDNANHEMKKERTRVKNRSSE